MLQLRVSGNVTSDLTSSPANPVKRKSLISRLILRGPRRVVDKSVDRGVVNDRKIGGFDQMDWKFPEQRSLKTGCAKCARISLRGPYGN